MKLALIVCLLFVPTWTAPQDEVRRELSKIEKRFKGADELEEKLALLEEGAALSKQAPSAPPARVGAFLGKALKDDEPVVREKALVLLLDGQDPEEVVDGLVDGWKDAFKCWKPLDAELREMNDGRGRYSKKSHISQAQMRAYTTWPRTYAMMIQSLGLVPDERVEKELCRLLDAKPDAVPGFFLVEACRAATALGSREAMEAQMECIARLDKQLEKGPLEARYPRSGSMLLMDAFLAPYAELKEDGYDAILEALEELAKTKGLGPTPGRGLGQADAWEDWFEQHHDAFAAELGRLGAPISVEPKVREQDDEG